MYPSHYTLLGIQNTETTAAISSAFKKMSLIWHPDKAITWVPEHLTARANEVFQRMSSAYNLLIDPAQRSKYDGILQFEKILPKSLSLQEIKQADEFTKEYKILKDAYIHYEKRMSEPTAQIEYLSAQSLELKQSYLEAKQRISTLEQQVQSLTQQLGAFQQQLNIIAAHANATSSNAEAVLSKSGSSMPNAFFTPITVAALSPQQKAFNVIFGELMMKWDTNNPEPQKNWQITFRLDSESFKGIMAFVFKIWEFFINKLQVDLEMYVQGPRSDAFYTLEMLDDFFYKSIRPGEPVSIFVALSPHAHKTYVADHIGKILPENQKIDEFLHEMFIGGPGQSRYKNN